MKKFLMFFILAFAYSYKCFSQKTTDTLLTTSTSATALYTTPNFTHDDIVNNVIKLIVAIATAIITQVLKDVFTDKRKKRDL